MLEEIVDIRNVHKALKQVMANKGAAGVDGMQTDELGDYLNKHWQTLRATLVSGQYHPQPVRSVSIPKDQGGTRELGIPTVVDRLIQQAIAQWLSPQYEAAFSVYSYGFRPGRNAHQAVLQAQTHLNDGYEWVIELDLEQFFDRVNHDRLMTKLATKIPDKRILKLLRAYLNCGIMKEGVSKPRTEGTPQGSPLSPLLSNIVLDELDQELHKRGHRFIRYADDCSVYVKSEKSAHSVMQTITGYIEKKLKLKINRIKSQVSRGEASTLLGFSFYQDEGRWHVRVAAKSWAKMKRKIKEQTPRKAPGPLKEKLKKMVPLIRGWVNYFAMASAKQGMKQLDGLVRMRLRMGLWKQWKTARTRIRQLRRLGMNWHKAYQWGHSSKGYCRVAHSPWLQWALNTAYFRRQGYIGFGDYYFWKTKHQTKLF